MVCPQIAETSTEKIEPDFTFEGLCRRCAPKHRNSRRETAGWDRVDRQEVFVLCWKAGPSPNVGSAKGTGREVLADGHNPTQLPALLISISRAPARAAESPKLSSPGAAPGRLANFVGPWLKSEAPALQAVTSGSVTRRTPPILTAGRMRFR